MRVRLLVWGTSGVLLRYTLEMESVPFCALALLYNRSLRSQRKELLQSSGTPIFKNAAQWTPLYLLALLAIRMYVCGPIALCIFSYLKICCLRVCLPITLNLGAD